MEIRLNAVNLLIALNFVVFIGFLILAMVITGPGGKDLFGNYSYWSVAMGGLTGVSVFKFGEWWRVLTYGFVHADPLHLLANMWSFYFLASHVRYAYSLSIMLGTYVVAIIVSGLATIFLSPVVITVGSSGGVFALAGILVGGALKRDRFGPDVPFSLMEIAPLVFISLFYGFLPGSNVNNVAHLAGLFIGLGIGYFIRPQLASRIPTGWERLINFTSVSLILGSLTLMVLSFFSLYILLSS